MKVWVINNLKSIFPDEEIVDKNIDSYLLQLCSHSLKMVTFLARFARQFGYAPKIMDFITAPNFDTLSKSKDATS
ncbi:hypothetical protein PSI15_08510 [Xenorhabdus sp. PR6a]|uniref:hypothetical protein n=1 Tax=Xenorhabdus sp. PR6a TaxID=3025877 RepID=UPI002358800E|nr:hypothetical protein [Xenorhabdus sp. PR6a]MDC9581602.1 hypothetical protein [Xenorhabdus sp. PR6a]